MNIKEKLLRTIAHTTNIAGPSVSKGLSLLEDGALYARDKAITASKHIPTPKEAANLLGQGYSAAKDKKAKFQAELEETKRQLEHEATMKKIKALRSNTSKSNFLGHKPTKLKLRKNITSLPTPTN